MKLTKIAAVLITTISLSNTAFSADKPNLGDITWGGGMEVQPGDTGWPSDLPMWGGGQELNPGDPGYQKPMDPGYRDIINSVSDVANKAYDDAQINKKDIKDTNDRIETAITDGKAALAETNEAIEKNKADTDKRIETAITDGKAALAETNEAIEKNKA
ncbi:hypothetical protein, partial [Providencia stuartii]|uniref:hypothetical protein n=1 Tax=Providencia stuartii TaxID=588 RepID=UPI0027F7D6DE